MGVLSRNCPRLPPFLSYDAPPDKLASGNGVAPAGTLFIQESQKWIELHYRVSAATQKLYHPKPGVPHSSVYRVAYLPRTREGQRLLIRFQYAFLHGHAFSVGYSRALQLDNQVTWSSCMPHKTATNGGGPFGYPDDSYLQQAHQALNRLGVPRDIQTCHQWCLHQHQHQQHQNRTETAVMVSDPRFVLRQETIQYVAPTRWNETYHFSKYFELVGACDPRSSIKQHQLPPSANVVPSMIAASAPLAVDLATILPMPPPAVDSLAEQNMDWASSNVRTSLRPATILTVEDLCNDVPIKNDCNFEIGCSICFKAFSSTFRTDVLSEPAVMRIKSCKHLCHQQCMLHYLHQGQNKCPKCAQEVGTMSLAGVGPSGAMTVILDKSKSCPGYSDGDGVICIHYKVPTGIQTLYMKFPGQCYDGTSRLAYLPNNESGRRLLVRLRTAFSQGYTFYVGTSHTTGLANQVMWTTIPHKPSLSGGIYGYPDPDYIQNCNDSLNALGVPSAENCVYRDSIH